jgi:outer membrane lipoprotein-sorting protein
LLAGRTALRALNSQRIDSRIPEQIVEQPHRVVDAVVDLTASEILNRVTAAYAKCNSYSDTGVQCTTFRGKRGHTNQKTFETYFVRDGGFRFEYAELTSGSMLEMLLRGEQRRVIWGDNHFVKDWWSIVKSGPSENGLGGALGGAHGVSGGTSTTIPEMLLPEAISGRRFTNESWLPVVAVESFGQHVCFRLQTGEGTTMTAIWIDRDSYLLRRVLENSVLDNDTKVEEVTVYEPSIDVAIDPARFTFEPPK